MRRNINCKGDKDMFIKNTCKKIKEQNNGITLVALVITIVLNCSCLATERNKRIAKI